MKLDKYIVDAFKSKDFTINKELGWHKRTETYFVKISTKTDDGYEPVFTIDFDGTLKDFSDKLTDFTCYADLDKWFDDYAHRVGEDGQPQKPSTLYWDIREVYDRLTSAERTVFFYVADLIRKDKNMDKRIELLKAMHTIMLNMNDEYAYMSWIELAVPDQPQDDDYVVIAEDDEHYKECVETFNRLIVKYGKGGIVG